MLVLKTAVLAGAASGVTALVVASCLGGDTRLVEVPIVEQTASRAVAPAPAPPMSPRVPTDEAAPVSTTTLSSADTRMSGPEDTLPGGVRWNPPVSGHAGHAAFDPEQNPASPVDISPLETHVQVPRTREPHGWRAAEESTEPQSR